MPETTAAQRTPPIYKMKLPTAQLMLLAALPLLDYPGCVTHSEAAGRN
jgi:hypothetical protein